MGKKSQESELQMWGLSPVSTGLTVLVDACVFSFCIIWLQGHQTTLALLYSLPKAWEWQKNCDPGCYHILAAPALPLRESTQRSGKFWKEWVNSPICFLQTGGIVPLRDAICGFWDKTIIYILLFFFLLFSSTTGPSWWLIFLDNLLGLDSPRRHVCEAVSAQTLTEVNLRVECGQ